MRQGVADGSRSRLSQASDILVAIDQSVVMPRRMHGGMGMLAEQVPIRFISERLDGTRRHWNRKYSWYR